MANELIDVSELRKTPAPERVKPRPPFIHCENEVKILGETLDGIIWQGRQWSVTEIGLERRNGTYCIPVRNLKMRGDPKSWIDHMSAKPSVDLPDFIAALGVTCLFHLGLK